MVPDLLPRSVQLLRDRKLYRDGVLTTASVIFVKPSGVFSWLPWSGLQSADVCLRFQVGTVGNTEARTVCRNDWLLKQLAPGTPVQIAYLPKRASRVALLDAYVR